MVDAILVKQAVEPGKEQQAKSLFEELGRMRNTESALELLKKEGVYTETAFLRKTEKGSHILYYIEAEDGERVQDVYNEIMADPDGEAEGMEAFIREFQEVVGGEPHLVEGEPLYHVVNPDR